MSNITLPFRMSQEHSKAVKISNMLTLDTTKDQMLIPVHISVVLENELVT